MSLLASIRFALRSLVILSSRPARSLRRSGPINLASTIGSYFLSSVDSSVAAIDFFGEWIGSMIAAMLWAILFSNASIEFDVAAISRFFDRELVFYTTRKVSRILLALIFGG